MVEIRRVVFLSVVYSYVDVTSSSYILIAINHVGTLLVGGDAGSRHGGDGLLGGILLGIDYDSIEGDGIETGRVAVHCDVIGLGGVIGTRVAI